MNSKTGEMIVCKLYRLFKMDGKYEKDLDRAKIVRNRAVITKDYYDMRNENWEENGEWYEKDSAATEKYYEDSAKQRADRKKKKQLENAGVRAITNAIAGANTGDVDSDSTEDDAPKTTKTEAPKEEPKEVEIPEGDPNYQWSRDELFAWIKSQDDCPDFKETLGKKQLWGKVIEPYMIAASEGNDDSTEDDNTSNEGNDNESGEDTGSDNGSEEGSTDESGTEEGGE